MTLKATCGTCSSSQYLRYVDTQWRSGTLYRTRATPPFCNLLVRQRCSLRVVVRRVRHANGRRGRARRVHDRVRRVADHNATTALTEAEECSFTKVKHEFICGNSLNKLKHLLQQQQHLVKALLSLGSDGRL